MQATARQFMREHPSLRITWERRTLQEFAEQSVLDLAEHYDLVVLDHPWIGAAVDRKCLLPLDEYLDAALLADQSSNTVGPSHSSYQRDGHQWALAIDTASHTSAFRPDLLAERQLTVPRTWDEVIALGGQLQGGKAQLAMPLTVVDCSCSFLSLCANLGEEPMRTCRYFVSRTIGRQALELMLQLRDMSHSESWNWNPPQLLDRMAETDEIAFCPLLFGYSNYARDGFRSHLVRFGNIPFGADSKPSGALLGGAGLAVSRYSRWPNEACAYAAFVASPVVQCGTYLASGGQPGCRIAWLDSLANDLCHQFFRDTLETLDRAYLRPTFNGYIAVQETVARLIHDFLRGKAGLDQTLGHLDAVYLANCT